MPSAEDRITTLEEFLGAWNQLRELTAPFAYQELRSAFTPSAEHESELAHLKRKILEALPVAQEALGDPRNDFTTTVCRALDSARSLYDLVLHPEFRETFRRDWGLVQQFLARGIGEIRLEARVARNPLTWITRAVTALRRSISYKDLAWWFVLALAAWKIYDWVAPVWRDFRDTLRALLARG